MRLRRETGDWTITNTGDAAWVQTIRKGLSAEDFIGAIVHFPTEEELQLEEVNRAGLESATGYIKFATVNSSLYYNPANGKVAADSSLIADDDTPAPVGPPVGPTTG